MSGTITLSVQSAASVVTPATGLRFYADSTSLKLASKDTTGAIVNYGLGGGSSLLIPNVQTASYTLALSDATNTLVTMNVATANTLVIPPSASVAWIPGSVIPITTAGAGATTVTAGAGVTLLTVGGAVVLGTPNLTGRLYYVATDTWLVALSGGSGGSGTVTSVTNSDGTIVVTGTGAAPIVSRAAITGDVAIAASGNTSTIGANAVTLGKIATQATATILGNNTGSTASPLALTAAQTKTLLAIASTDVSGLAASATTDTTNAANISSGTLPAGRLPALTGDVTTTVGTAATTLASVITAGGPIGSSTTVPVITYDAKGRLTAVTSATITAGSGTVTSVTNSDGTIVVTGAGAAPIVSRAAITGDVAIAAAGNTSVLASTITAAGPIGSATTVPIITYDAKGRLTTVTSTTIAGVTPAGSAGGDLTGTYPNPTLATSGSTLQTGYAGRIVNTVAAAASAPPMAITGTVFTGGTATTTKPQFLLEPSGTTTTGWNTSGTMLGVNAPSGFSGRLLDCQLNGVTVCNVIASGTFQTTGAVQAGALGSLGLAAYRIGGILTCGMYSQTSNADVSFQVNSLLVGYFKSTGLDLPGVKGISVGESANGKQGVATLVAGTVTVSNTSITATSRIFLTAQSLGTVTVPTALAVTARTAGTSFTITSANAVDTSVVAYEIFEVG